MNGQNKQSTHYIILFNDEPVLKYLRPRVPIEIS